MQDPAGSALKMQLRPQARAIARRSLNGLGLDLVLFIGLRLGLGLIVLVGLMSNFMHSLNDLGLNLVLFIGLRLGLGLVVLVGLMSNVMHHLRQRCRTLYLWIVIAMCLYSHTIISVWNYEADVYFGLMCVCVAKGAIRDSDGLIQLFCKVRTYA